MVGAGWRPAFSKGNKGSAPKSVRYQHVFLCAKKNCIKDFTGRRPMRWEKKERWTQVDMPVLRTKGARGEHTMTMAEVNERLGPKQGPASKFQQQPTTSTVLKLPSVVKAERTAKAAKAEHHRQGMNYLQHKPR